jgi:hypothetical protein
MTKLPELPSCSDAGEARPKAAQLRRRKQTASRAEAGAAECEAGLRRFVLVQTQFKAREEALLARVTELEAAAEGAQDTPPARTGSLDVLCQHVLGMACAAPFLSDELYEEITCAEPYARLAREDFDDVVTFVATGGYALQSYDRFAKIKRLQDGRWRIANAKIAQAYRMNVGTIIESDMLKVRLVRGVAAKGSRAGAPRGSALYAPAKLAPGAQPSPGASAVARSVTPNRRSTSSASPSTAPCSVK